MVNQSPANQSPVQAQHQQSPQQSQSPQQQKLLQQFSPSIQLQAGGSGQQHIALVKTSSGTMATTGGMTLAQIKPGQLKPTLTGVRSMQLQQIPIGQHQQRKNLAGKMTQITQVSSNISGSTTSGTTNVAGGTKTTPVGSTQLIVQNPKVTVQQIMRQAQPNQIVLGKRIIPVSVSSQAAARQTIQVS